MSGRGLGDMKQPRVFARALRALGLDPARWAGGRQVHGRRVRVVRRPSAPGEFPRTDGLIGSSRGPALRVFAADCAPVFLYQPGTGDLGLLHAGRRGVDQKILTAGLRALRRRAGPRAPGAWVAVGPHIRDCCYEVGEDVARKFRRVPGALKTSRDGRTRLSLAAALRREARRAGAARWWAAPWCTACDPGFFSHRRDKTEKRHVAVLASRAGR